MVSRQGIAYSFLMQALNAYFEGKEEVILYVETPEAYQLYQKVGYSRRLPIESYEQKSLSTTKDPLHLNGERCSLKISISYIELKKHWGTNNFPVFWNSQVIGIHQFNMKQYRVLHRGNRIIGYAKWDDPSEHRPQGLIHDPIVPDEDPMEIITSVQAEITATLLSWKTTERSIYETPLRSLGCIFKQGKMVDMVASLGKDIDLTTDAIVPCGEENVPKYI